MNTFLIGGTGRSGTTILRDIFAHHPEIISVPEWRFIIDPDGIIDFYNTFSNGWSPYLYSVKIKRLEKLLNMVGKTNYVSAGISYFSKKYKLQNKLPVRIVPAYSEVVNTKRYSPNYFVITEKLIDRLTDFKFKGQWFGSEYLQKNLFYYSSPIVKIELAKIFREFYTELISDVLLTHSKKYYLEKNTWNILWYDKIQEILPDVKLIHIYRDPRDVVASFMSQAWSPSNATQAAIFFRDIMDQWWKIRNKLPEESYLEISLESLVSEPKSTLNKICAYLNLNWDDSLLKINLSRSNTGRWKKNLTKEQQADVNSILKDHIVKMNYK